MGASFRFRGAPGPEEPRARTWRAADVLDSAVLPEALLEILVCPKSLQPMIYFPRGERDAGEAEAFLVCPASRLRYAIGPAGVAALMTDEATELDQTEVDRLVRRARELGLRVP